MQAICKVDSSFIGYPVNICIRDTVGFKKINNCAVFTVHRQFNLTSLKLLIKPFGFNSVKYTKKFANIVFP